jgi:hypothetical protein
MATAEVPSTMAVARTEKEPEPVLEKRKCFGWPTCRPLTEKVNLRGEPAETTKFDRELHAESATFNSAFWMRGKGERKFSGGSEENGEQEKYREFNLHVDDRVNDAHGVGDEVAEHCTCNTHGSVTSHIFTVEELATTHRSWRRRGCRRTCRDPQCSSPAAAPDGGVRGRNSTK